MGVQPGSKGQLPTSVLTLVPARSNVQFDWLCDNKRLTNYSKELLLGFVEKLVNSGSLPRENRTKDWKRIVGIPKCHVCAPVDGV